MGDGVGSVEGIWAAGGGVGGAVGVGFGSETRRVTLVVRLT